MMPVAPSLATLGLSLSPLHCLCPQGHICPTTFPSLSSTALSLRTYPGPQLPRSGCPRLSLLPAPCPCPRSLQADPGPPIPCYPVLRAGRAELPLGLERKGEGTDGKSDRDRQVEGTMAPSSCALHPSLLTWWYLGHQVPIACFSVPAACCTTRFGPALWQAAPSLPTGAAPQLHFVPCLLWLPTQASRGRSMQHQPVGGPGVAYIPLSSLLAMGRDHSGPQLLL